MNKEFFKKYPNYKYYYKNYLGAWSFVNGERTLTIKDIGESEMYNQETGGKKVEPVIYFQEEELPMVCNPTNADTIAEVLGTGDWSKWIGQKIIVGASKIKAFGKQQDAIRVRSKKPDNTIYSCENCGQVITPVAGKTPGELAEIAKRNTGKVLCVNCMKKVKAEMDKANNGEV